MNCNNTIEFEIDSVINMLKYALSESHSIDTLNCDTSAESDNTESSIFEMTKILFKKINITFKALSKIIKILLLLVNDEKYQDSINHDIRFPPDMDTLIIVLGTFDKAFTHEITEQLFYMLSFPAYSDLYKISNINSLLIPFVANGDINYKSLNLDYSKFINIVKDFTCDVLNLNTDFEYSDIIETVIGSDVNQLEPDPESDKEAGVPEVNQLESGPESDKEAGVPEVNQLEPESDLNSCLVPPS